MDVCGANCLEGRESIFLRSRGQVCLLSSIIKMRSSRTRVRELCWQPFIKYCRSLRSGILSPDTHPLRIQHPHRPPRATPVGLGKAGMMQTGRAHSLWFWVSAQLAHVFSQHLQKQWRLTCHRPCTVPDNHLHGFKCADINSPQIDLYIQCCPIKMPALIVCVCVCVCVETANFEIYIQI